MPRRQPVVPRISLGDVLIVGVCLGPSSVRWVDPSPPKFPTRVVPRALIGPSDVETNQTAR